MDRLARRLVAPCGLGLMVLALGSGCRNMHSEVPPGRPMGGPGQAPPVSFSSDPAVPGNAGFGNGIPPSAMAGRGGIGGNGGAGGYAGGQSPFPSTYAPQGPGGAGGPASSAEMTASYNPQSGPTTPMPPVGGSPMPAVAPDPGPAANPMPNTDPISNPAGPPSSGVGVMGSPGAPPSPL